MTLKIVIWHKKTKQKKRNKVLQVTLPMTASSFDSESAPLASAAAASDATVRMSSLEDHQKKHTVFKFKFSKQTKQSPQNSAIVFTLPWLRGQLCSNQHCFVFRVEVLCCWVWYGDNHDLTHVLLHVLLWWRHGGAMELHNKPIVWHQRRELVIGCYR